MMRSGTHSRVNSRSPLSTQASPGAPELSVELLWLFPQHRLVCAQFLVGLGCVFSVGEELGVLLFLRLVTSELLSTPVKKMKSFFWWMLCFL